VTFISITKEGHEHGNEDHDHHHDHDHPSGNPWSLVITAIPLLLGILVPAKPLAASVIESRGVSNEVLIRFSGSDPGQELSTRTPADQRTILDWIRLFNYSEDPTEFRGETADVIGFVYHDPRLEPNQFLISRLAITCCVADAFAIGMVVDWDQASEFPDNTWVHVRGEVQAIELNGETTPLIVAESVKETDEPDKPYLYP
jgi:uncharacterized repeat protein (TIGR03943 family)